MDFAFTDEQRLLRDNVQRMMARVAPPERIRELDRAAEYPEAIYAAWVDMGLIALPFPEAEGGLGGSPIDLVIVAEELAYRSFDFFQAWGASVFCGLNVARHGTPEQRARWLPPLLAGEIKMSISMSEPDAGSDVGALRTSARRDGERWVIDGQKLWATGAGAARNVLNVYVRTDREADHRKALSLVLVENDAPGVRLRKLDMLGRRCVGTYEIFFDGVTVDADRIVGGENRGWDVMLSGLQLERLTTTAGYIGGTQAVLDLALEHAKTRRQFGRPIGSFQAIAHQLADMAAELEAARTLMWRAAWCVANADPGSRTGALREISMAKLFASEVYVKAANAGMQICGAMGYSMEFDMQRLFRDSRASTIAAGTSQMQRNLIASLMGLAVDRRS